MTTIPDLITEARDVGDKRRNYWPTPRIMATLFRKLADALEAEHARAEAAEKVIADIRDAQKAHSDWPVYGRILAAHQEGRTDE